MSTTRAWLLVLFCLGCGGGRNLDDAGPAFDGSADAADDAGPTDAGLDARQDDTGMGDADTDGGPPLPATHHVVVRVLGAGSGRVTSEAGLDCSRSAGGTCLVEVEHHTVLRLEATPTEGSTFSGWSDTSCGSALGCEIRVDADVVLEATFDLRSERLTLDVSEGGHVTHTPGATVCTTGTCVYDEPHGSVVSLTASANPSHRFVGWTDDCADVATATCTLRLDGPRTVGAVFAVRTDSLTVVEAGTGDGRVTSTPTGIDCPGDCSEPLPLGSMVRLVASANEGSVFTGWSGACTGTSPCDVTVDGSTVVVASFARRTYPLNVTQTGDGQARVTASEADIDCGTVCSTTVPHGTTVILSVSPEVGSELVTWSGGCAAAGSAPTCTVTVTAALTVGVNVARRTYPVQVAREGTGIGRVRSNPTGIDCGTDCSETVVHGTHVQLDATADPSSTFSGWGGPDCTGTGACDLVVTGPTNVTAGFALRTYVTSTTVRSSRSGMGRITSTPSGIDCGADCSHTWNHGAVVTLTAAPALGSTFVGWSDPSGACAGVGPCVLTVDRARAIEATFEGHTPVRLNPADRDPDVRIREYDRLAADLDLDFGGVRSDVSIGPGSGVFYFEGRRTTNELGPYGVGVCSGTYPLNGTSVGSTDQAFGVTATGGIDYDSTFQGLFDATATTHYGMVVDYRGSHPIVHAIIRDFDWDLLEIRPKIGRSLTMTNVTTPVYILAAGLRTVVGEEIEINAGNDTTNFPFHYDVRAVLRAAGLEDVANALVLGWGGTYAGPVSSPPSVTVSADAVVSNGSMVTVNATATDPEDGSLTGAIEWELLSSPHYLGRIRGSGGSFSFTATGVGIHPARARVVDSTGHVTEAVVRIRVPGPVATPATTRLEADPLSGDGVVLDPSGTRARFTGLGKMGIRANQSCYGCFWYFEFYREHAPENMGGGLVTGMGNLSPFDWDDVPQSIAINILGGSWRNLIPKASFPSPASSFDHYGVAVDYRGEHPIVYVIVDDVLHYQVEMTDTWTEIYPMLYGNPVGTPAGSFDEGVNFGDAPFTYDPVAILSAEGIDTSGLVVGWGL
jgi:hypothetical protein